MDKQFFELTNPQKSIWLTNKVYSNTSINNICSSMVIQEEVNFEVLQKAVNLFVEKNDSFQIKLIEKDGHVQQYCSDFTPFRIELIELNDDHEMKQLEDDLVSLHFNLIDSLLFKFVMFKLPNKHGGLALCAHHLIFDAWTSGLVINEIIDIYSFLVHKSIDFHDDSFPSYFDYIHSEEEYMQGQKFINDKLFWEENYQTVPEIASIPSFKEHSSSSLTCNAQREQFIISQDLVSKIHSFCINCKASIFNFFMATFAIYLSNVSKLEEFVIGTPILNRCSFKEKHTTGMFISTVPFKMHVSPEDSFLNLITNISRDALSIFRHQKYPYQYLLEYIRKTNHSLPNLYDILISYQNMRSNPQNSNISYTSKWIPNNCISNSLDIHIFDINDTGNLTIAYDYLVDKYSKEEIVSIHQRILYILDQVLNNQSILVKDIEIVTPHEKDTIVHEFNNTICDYPKNKTIPELFEEQVVKTPNQTALVFGDTQLTYQELNDKVNSLAHYLQNLGITPHSIIGIMVNRSLEMFIAMLGVLKAGATYLPIDPEYPVDRIHYMLTDSKASLLLINHDLKDKIDFEHKICVDLTEPIYLQPSHNIQKINNPEDAMYIIYTSGSTGLPKGVVLTHKNIVNFIYGTSKVINFSGKTIVSLTTISFDIFVLESFLALLNGLKIVIANEEEQRNVSLFNNLCLKNNVHIIQTTPSRLQAFLADHTDYLANITDILVGGEPLPASLLTNLQKSSKAKIYNMYGPTETAVWSTICDVTNSTNITIGKPISNTYCYILDENGRLLPPNVPGNLFIGGDGVSNGYLYKEELTKEKFVPNPYHNGFMYNTNDLAYYTFTGELVHLGRTDFQVKINGYRIELGEIENKISQFPNIQTAIVNNLKVDNHSVLVAYFTASNKLDISLLKKNLQNTLPQYMIPQFFMQLDEFPYTPNGKIDRKRLPLPELNSGRKIIPPRNEIDIKLLTLLEELLHLPEVSIADSFFEIGGDSLSAITLSSKIFREFHVEISVKEIMENSTISDLSNLISNKNKLEEIPLKKAPKSNYYPVSFAQKRIYYATKMISEKNIVYNISGGLLVDKILNPDKIEEAVSKIINIQSSFRTQFKIIDSQLVQEIVPNIKFKASVYYDSIQNIKQIVNEFPKPFNIEVAPLLRIGIYFLDNQKTLILIDTHHIIMDGASLNIFIKEFCEIYNNKDIHFSTFEYIDYSTWEKEFMKTKKLKEFDKYWSSTFSNTEIPVLNLPYDFPVTNIKTYIGDKISCTIPTDLFLNLEKLASNLHISSYTLFLTSLYILLYKYTGQNTLVIASPIAGRPFEEFANTIGMFVNNILLKQNIEVNNSIRELLDKTQNIVSDAISNQPYPYDFILEKLNLKNDSSLLDVVLTYQNNSSEEYQLDGSSFKLLYANTHTSKFNIWIEIIPQTYTFNIEYNSSLFKKDTIQSFLEHYIFILEQVLNNTSTLIEDIKIITPKESQLLEQFNHTDQPINNDTIVSIFEEQVKLTPNNIALICDSCSLTYDELNKKANSLAHLLIEKGIKANDIVCIMTNRSLETIICMLAILKAGAAFFNVDPTYPIERTKYYIEDSKTRYVLTQSELKDSVKSIENCIEIDLSLEDIYNKNFDNPNVKIGMYDLSYLIYTSGSTGQPKGVMLNQVGLANMTKSMSLVLEYLKEGNKHCIASVTSTPFDIFVYEIIVSLTHGLRVVMANNAEHRSPKLLDKLIRKYNVDVMTVTPSLMKINYDNREPNTALANVKNMVFGGEPLPEKFVTDLRALADDITIYNIYGPSEITILSNVQNLNGEKEITIGPPIMNTQIHILDKNMQRVPIGVTGEIYISGIQVGCGYMNKPELTAEKFLDNPFGSGKMYKSGDVGRWTFEGKVQCLGRVDHQIKLRGLRIELGEIENVLLNIDGITSAVVNKIELDGKEFLCAYFVSNKNIDENQIRDILRKALPPYMIPTYLVKLDEMPYTINRKIDRKALPLPKFNKPVVNSSISIEHLNSSEEKLLQIWKNILKTDDIDINDNFFNIGGDSVLAITMQIEAIKYGLEFEYSDIFSFPTIKQLSEKSRSADFDFMKNFNFDKINHILVRNTIDNLSTIKETTVSNILLIGGTGYLGAHILNSFLSNNTGIVYCLVRNKNGIDITQRLYDTLSAYFGKNYVSALSSRIKIIHGDIVNPNLGLSDEDYKLLVNNIDTVINSGALVKHFGLKNKFHEINVIGTQNIIDFCKRNHKRLLHISTISVSGNGEKEESVIETEENKNNKKIFKESDIYIGQNIKGVYTTTKFEAELSVLEAIANGLDAQILRLRKYHK